MQAQEQFSRNITLYWHRESHQHKRNHCLKVGVGIGEVKFSYLKKLLKSRGGVGEGKGEVVLEKRSVPIVLINPKSQ